MQVTFSFHISCVGVSVFSLLKSVDGDITNTPLVPRFGPRVFISNCPDFDSCGE